MKRATMAAFSSKPSIRSISLPARSHPTTQRIEEELNNLRSLESSSLFSSKTESILFGLSGLSVLYKCMEDLLNLPLTQQALSQHQHQRWVNESLEGSLMYLDLCGNTRDSIVLMQESIRELQSALRRRKFVDLSIETSINSYNSSRKGMKKDFAKSLASLKPIGNDFEASYLLDLDDHLSAVVRVLRETSLITESIFQSLLLFLSVPVLKPKPNKWSLVSKLVHKGAQENMNGLEKVDIALGNLVMHNSSKEDILAQKIQSAQARLEALDVTMEGLEKGLECLFRHLIQTRVFLLNIISQ